MMILPLLLSAALVHAAPPAKPAAPRAELKRLMAELAANPGDAALREKAAKAAAAVRPAPELPDEATMLAGKAAYAFKAAKSPPDFGAAADAYRKASVAAPWVPDYYFNEGVALEKAERYSEAIAAFKLYLAASPKAKDRAKVLERIGGIQFLADKAEAEAYTRMGQQMKRNQAEAVLDRIRSIAQGRTYTRNLCVSSKIPIGNGGSQAVGCNRTEFDGKYWQNWGNSTNGFLFPGDGTVVFGFLAGGNSPTAITLRGTPQGAEFSDIKWECPKLKWEGTEASIESWSEAWMTGFNGDLTDFTFSCDRPNRSWDEIGPSARYMYWWYHRD